MIIILSLNIDYVSANSAHPNGMPYSVVFHLGFHCLQKYPFIWDGLIPCFPIVLMSLIIKVRLMINSYLFSGIIYLH